MWYRADYCINKCGTERTREQVKMWLHLPFGNLLTFSGNDKVKTESFQFIKNDGLNGVCKFITRAEGAES